jgi:hypothetical protein
MDAPAPVSFCVAVRTVEPEMKATSGKPDSSQGEPPLLVIFAVASSDPPAPCQETEPSTMFALQSTASVGEVAGMVGDVGIGFVSVFVVVGVIEVVVVVVVVVEDVGGVGEFTGAAIVVFTDEVPYTFTPLVGGVRPLEVVAMVSNLRLRYPLYAYTPMAKTKRITPTTNTGSIFRF